MACKISKTGWIVLGAGAAVTDVAQFLIGFFGVLLSEIVIGAFLVAANDVADPFIGGAVALYLQLRGVSLIQQPSRLLSLLCVGGLDEITGGMASFWVLDIWYIYNSVQKQEAAEATTAEAAAFESQGRRRFANFAGRRNPSSRGRAGAIESVNRNGRRVPQFTASNIDSPTQPPLKSIGNLYGQRLKNSTPPTNSNDVQAASQVDVNNPGSVREENATEEQVAALRTVREKEFKFRQLESLVKSHPEKQLELDMAQEEYQTAKTFLGRAYGR